MGSVTKTIMEGVGDAMKSTSYHFSSFEDFVEYERAVTNSDGVNCSFTITKAPLKVGKQYRVIKDVSSHGQDIGSLVTVTKYDDWDECLPYQVEDDFGNRSWLTAEEVEEIGAQSANIKIGKGYKIVGNFKNHEFPIGTVVQVTERHPTSCEEYRAEYLDGHDWWWVYAQDLEEI